MVMTSQQTPGIDPADEHPARLAGGAMYAAKHQGKNRYSLAGAQ
jgi:GGDEF domain-containing protein